MIIINLFIVAIGIAATMYQTNKEVILWKPSPCFCFWAYCWRAWH